MARIRTIKPEFWQDEKLAPLDAVTRLVFLGLISQADDAGRLIDNVKLIDGLLFPETDESSRDALDTLARLGRIIRYTSESGQRLIQIANWAEHQRVDKPSKNVLPPPPPEALVTTHDTEPSRNTRESVATPSGETRAPTLDHGPRKKDLKPTGSDDPEAAPRGSIDSEASDDEDPAQIDPTDRKALRALFAPLVREHLWLGKRPPPGILRSDAKWGMHRELNILVGFVEAGRASPEEVAGAIEVVRPVLGFDDDVPLSARLFNVADRHDRLQVCVAYWRRKQPKRLQPEVQQLIAVAGGAYG